ncbi:DUF4337 domain-containing protein [uncultured Selenomonas sp.]|uniref:DUF4337 domain-containing protein n=1 Tax=uncultured Selenomonas sp. TaxID=159275 RepID=UPI0025EDF3E4|nr:DUF4337 domain-containing protein [uncultured Selenomonas sp.]
MAEEKKTEDKKEEDGEKKFSDRQTKLVALTALLLAICATFSSLKAGGLSNTAILAQSQASDQWAYYQAKSLKENTYKVQLDAIKLHQGQFDAAQADKIAAGYQEKIDQYKQEEKEISDKAKGLEAQRDHALELRKGFSSGLTYLQIAILLASLTALVKQLMFWYASIVVGVVGAYYFFSTLILL